MARRARCSNRKIPCQVPSCIRESATGITSLDRVSTIRMCEGMSSGPSQSCSIIGVLGHEPLEEFLQIAARGRVGVLHDDEAATGVLDENGHRARGDPAAVDDFATWSVIS